MDVLDPNHHSKYLVLVLSRFAISSSLYTKNSRREKSETKAWSLNRKKNVLEGPKTIGLFEKNLLLWKIYLVSGTALFHSIRSPNQSLAPLAVTNSDSGLFKHGTKKIYSTIFTRKIVKHVLMNSSNSLFIQVSNLSHRPIVQREKTVFSDGPSRDNEISSLLVQPHDQEVVYIYVTLILL